tara:strand:- start:2141 stop:2569 length:429 start_codon:yes stop_codon:yes gene_type:complete
MDKKIKIPDNVLNPELYLKARQIADKTYKKHGAYKNMFLVSEYKRLGGKYSGKKPDKKSGLSKWIKEEWIQVIPFLEKGEKIICGAGDNKKGCRPMKKLDSKTPITLQELIKIHGKEKLLKLAKEKRKDMNKRINWKLGKIY